MAGFDFEFTYDADHMRLVTASLEAAKRRARVLGISMRVRHERERGLVLVTVNGQSRRLDLLGVRLERDLPSVAEGVPIAASPRRRRALGLGLADMYLRGRDMSTEGPMRLQAVSDTRYWFSPFGLSYEAHSQLGARLRVTETVFIDWLFGEVPAEVALEEMHTGFELVLNELVNRRSKKLSFAELVEAAEEQGHLEGFDRMWAHGVVTPRSPLPGRALLTSLKDLRKSVRHRAAAGSAAWLDAHFETGAMLLEHLAHRVLDRSVA